MVNINAQAAQIGKLAIKLDDHDLAEALVAAGLDNPAKIRRATDEELGAVPGLSKAGAQRLRVKLPRRE